MFDDFLIRAGLAGIGLALAAGPLGCFVVWRKMAYFGDATAHAALLGVALALFFQVSIFAGILFVALGIGAGISLLQTRARAMDTTLGVMAHSALALGLVAIAMMKGQRIDLQGFLFGDILAVNEDDLLVIWAGAVLVLALLVWRWQALLTATLNHELARASGFHSGREQMILVLALALVVAVAIKVVGALLISAMLIIPAATARAFSETPERMAGFAVFLGVIAVIGGIYMSLQLDTPTGPSIVVTAAGLYALSLLRRR